MQLASELDTDYQITFKRLCAFFRGRGVSADEASDLAQDTASKTWSHLKRNGRKLDDLDPLMYRIAKNVLVEFWRAKRVAIEPLEDHDLESGTDAYSVREVDARLQAAWIMDGLSKPQRRALGMWVEGFRPAEIAKTLGIKRNAVDQLLHRARRALASRLKDSTAFVVCLWSRTRSAVREGGRRLHTIASPAGEMAGQACLALTALGLSALSATGGVVEAPQPDPRPSLDSSAAANADRPVPTVREPASADLPRARGAEEGEDENTPPYETGLGVPLRNPTTGEDEEVGFDIWYDPDEGGRGPLDTPLESVMRTACDTEFVNCTRPGE